ncbi:hypothetical protein CCR95_17520 [Thiocystis minor]|nr:hypothetical protein [Thiocystis minor]
MIEKIFGRHGSLAQMMRLGWRRLPLGIATKQRIRHVLLKTMSSGYRAISSDSEQSAFQPSVRFTSEAGFFAPQVTVVVPNYNHAPYLRQRLDSIYGQTYPNFQVLLLDDFSTDDSRSILEEYAEKHRHITTTIFNQQNSGGVFRQWLRAIQLAETELIWIAESDDYCDLNFLETLVPFFMDEAVKLAYSHSVFVTEQGKPALFRFEDYLGELSTVKWRQTYVAAAHAEVVDFLGRKNTIPNVSSAVFRKFDPAFLLAESDWLEMKICGDWVFYLHAARGGKIAYTVDVHNYYRFHADNSSVKTYATPVYYREHERVAIEIARLYRVPVETLAAHKYFVKQFFDQNAFELRALGIEFEALYDDERIREATEKRLPHIMMASFAFASGGGEIFPIRLANALAQRGYAVTFFDFRGEPINFLVREMLKPDIPVIELTNRFLDVDSMIDSFGIDIIHSHHASVDQFLAVSSLGQRRSNVTHIVTLHGMYDDMQRDIFDRTLQDVYPAVSRWVYISDKNLIPFKQRNLYREERFIKIPNGMSAPNIQAVQRSVFGIEDNAFVVCVASRAIPEKGWREAIEVIREARSLSGVDIQLLLLGDGVLYETLKAETVPAFVHLLGFVKDAVNYYAAADVGMLLTTFGGESFPLTIIECLMAGRPVIASDIGEIRNMLTNEKDLIAGYLVDISDGKIPIEATAYQVVELATNPIVSSAKQALAKEQSSCFDLGRVVDLYASAYRYPIATEVCLRS